MELRSFWDVAKSYIYDNSGIGKFCWVDVCGVTMRIAFQRGAVEQAYYAKLDWFGRVLAYATGRLWSPFRWGGWSHQDGSGVQAVSTAASSLTRGAGARKQVPSACWDPFWAGGAFGAVHTKSNVLLKIWRKKPFLSNSCKGWSDCHSIEITWDPTRVVRTVCTEICKATNDCGTAVAATTIQVSHPGVFEETHCISLSSMIKGVASRYHATRVNFAWCVHNTHLIMARCFDSGRFGKTTTNGYAHAPQAPSAKPQLLHSSCRGQEYPHHVPSSAYWRLPLDNHWGFLPTKGNRWQRRPRPWYRTNLHMFAGSF